VDAEDVRVGARRLFLALHAKQNPRTRVSSAGLADGLALMQRGFISVPDRAPEFLLVAPAVEIPALTELRHNPGRRPYRRDRQGVHGDAATRTTGGVRHVNANKDEMHGDLLCVNLPSECKTFVIVALEWTNVLSEKYLKTMYGEELLELLLNDQNHNH